MRLFGKSKHGAGRQDDEAEAVRARLQELRRRLSAGRGSAGLPTLADGAPDARPGLASAGHQEPQRVWPHEVPASNDAEHTKVTYGDWELMRPPSRFTVR